MNDELMQALQAGQITLAQYKQAVQDLVMNSSDISGDMKNALGRRGLDTPQERDMLQGLLGQQQMGQATTEPEWQPPKYEVPRPNAINPMMGQQSPAQMPQAPEPTMPMMPMPSVSPSKMIMSPMPEISGRGAPTQNETDFLGQFVDNAKKAMGGRPNVDTPQQRDYLQNIMQGYNKRY